jgi:hypothetical protein
LDLKVLKAKLVQKAHKVLREKLDLRVKKEKPERLVHKENKVFKVFKVNQHMIFTLKVLK